MIMRFREDKATQIAALFLRLGGGQMDILKIVKLMYLAERESIIRWGRPITYDNYSSLPHGPVLSTTLNLINYTLDIEPPAYWHLFITERDGHKIRLTDKPAATDQLSEAEEKLVNEIFGKFGGMDPWKLREYTHTLPEWVDPQGSSLPIQINEILAAEGYDKAEIAEMENALMAEAEAQACLG